MDPGTVPATPDALAAMFQNATIDTAERSEFSNSARDMFKLVLNNNFNFTKEDMHDSSDVINHLLKVIPLLLAEVRKGKDDSDHSPSNVAETTGTIISDPVPQGVTPDQTLEIDPVDVIDMVPSSPLSLPVASIADRYTRCMLKCLVGYPLYEPQPFSERSKEYLRHGVNVGDVGFIRGDGVFDFLFNVCPSQNGLINPSILPEGFSLEASEDSETREMRPFPRDAHLFQSPVVRTKSGEYICEGSEGAILELPDGAIQNEATNIRPFAKLAARHGVQWYEYTMKRGREISNGSLYLITSFTKCAQWGIAVFDRPCALGQGLRFEKKRSLPFGKSSSKYNWKGSRVFHTKISDLNQKDAPNQCVFLRGYKIMIRQDIFDNLCNESIDRPQRLDQPKPSSQAESTNMTRQPATRIRGGAGPDPISKRPTGKGLLSRTPMGRRKSDEVILYANFNSSLVHPSDLVNAALLSQNAGAEVALTHDDFWCDLLHDTFPKLNYRTLINIARSYTTTVDGNGCVALAKISGASTNVEESNYRSQEIETPVLQEFLTTHVNDASASDTSSLILPRELVERILRLLDTKSMLLCRLVNREFNEIIQSSTVLQYYLTCKAAGVIDNPDSPLSCAERLEALKKREDAWRLLKPVFEMTIEGIHQTSTSFSRSTEGAYFFTDENRKYLKYSHLPSSFQANTQWTEIPGNGPGEVWPGIWVNFETAAYEHDLIVNFLSSDIGNQANIQQRSLDLVLLKLSTGEYHPLARHPHLHVQRSSGVRPQVVARIVGDNLAFVVHIRDGTSSDKLFIFDWKTGQKRLQHETTENGYLNLVFVSPQFLLVPNRARLSFEVWHLPLSHPKVTPPVQVLSLRLPTLSSHFSLYTFDCRGEPNPFLHSTLHLPSRPFFPSPESSIVITRLRISSDTPFSNIRATYNLIMHRRSLLDTIQKWTSSSRFEEQDLPTWWTNGVTVNEISDPEDGSITLYAHSKLVSTMLHPQLSPTTRESPTSANSQNHRASPSSDTPSKYSFPQVEWAEWGPSISRWFRVNETQARWLTLSNGQRYAFSEPSPSNKGKLMVNVADFNPHNVKRDTELQGGVEAEESELLDHEGIFSEEVYMGLKCVLYRAPDEYDFDLVEMNEERLLGVKLNRGGWEESIKVLYFG